MSTLYGFAYTDAALEFLEGSVQAKFRGQVKRKIQKLALDPNPPGCKKMDGYGDGEECVYRIRSGDYRILYVVRSNPDEIVVLDIDHRKDIYR
jgi:mRNA interferase RelE/StbE